MKEKTFKQLITQLSQIKTADDMQQLCADIDKSYNADKITPADNETLYRIVRMIDIRGNI